MMRSLYEVNLSPCKPPGTPSLTGLTLRITAFDAKTTNNPLIVKLLTDSGFEPAIPKTYEIIWVDNDSLFINFPLHELLDTTTSTEAEGVKSVVSLTYKDGEMASIVWPSGWKIETFAQYLRSLAAQSAAAAAEKRLNSEVTAEGDQVQKRARVD